jgi:hypothetical protein
MHAHGAGAETISMKNLPNILTMSRIAVIPALIALIWIGTPTLRWIALGIYAVACITDILDGYLARSMNQQSSLGRLFDPIADKLLVGGCLLVLCAFDYITGWSVLSAVIILLREILVSGLREYLAEIRVGLPVSRLEMEDCPTDVLARLFDRRRCELGGDTVDLDRRGLPGNSRRPYPMDRLRLSAFRPSPRDRA